MSVTNTKEFYEKNFDESKRLTGGDNRHLVEFERKKWLYSKMIDEYEPQVILQIACGTGVFTDWICETYPNTKVIATDLVDKHIDSLKDHDNLIQKLVWDCSGSLPNFGCKIDMVFVEGAWYHLNDRTQLIKNLNEIGAPVVIIDWLSAWHDATQQLLKNKKMPADYRNPRPDEPFVFDTKDDIDALDELKEYLVRLFPVDMNTRFGYKDFNEVPAEEFYNYIAQLNKTTQLYSKEQTFIMNATEHGCYVLTKGNSLLTVSPVKKAFYKYGKRCRLCGGTHEITLTHHFPTVRPYWGDRADEEIGFVMYADKCALFPVCNKCREDGTLDTYRKVLTNSCKKFCAEHGLKPYQFPKEIARLYINILDSKEIKTAEDAIYIGEKKYEKVHK